MKRFTISLTVSTAVLALPLGGCAALPSSEGDTEGEEQTRTVTDATDTEVDVPSNPQRIVTLHYSATQPVLDLGSTPVGQGTFEDGIIPEEKAEEVEDIPVVTDDAEPKLEEVAKLEPDLILAPNIHEEEVVEQLESIAPVYTFTLRGGDRAQWTQRTEEIADALGVPEAVEQLQEEFEARQQEIAEEHADVIADQTVAVIGAYEENSVYVWGEDNMTGTLLLPLGLTWSEQENAAVEGEPEPEATLSDELLTSAVDDADIIFLDSNLRGEVNSFMADLQDTALYEELPAVQDGHVYPAGKNTVAGYTDAHYTLDQVEEAFKDVGDE